MKLSSPLLAIVFSMLAMVLSGCGAENAAPASSETLEKNSIEKNIPKKEASQQ